MLLFVVWVLVWACGMIPAPLVVVVAVADEKRDGDKREGERREGERREGGWREGDWV